MCVCVCVPFFHQSCFNTIGSGCLGQTSWREDGKDTFGSIWTVAGGGSMSLNNWVSMGYHLCPRCSGLNVAPDVVVAPVVSAHPRHAKGTFEVSSPTELPVPTDVPSPTSPAGSDYVPYLERNKSINITLVCHNCGKEFNHVHDIMTPTSVCSDETIAPTSPAPTTPVAPCTVISDVQLSTFSPVSQCSSCSAASEIYVPTEVFTSIMSSPKSEHEVEFVVTTTQLDSAVLEAETVAPRSPLKRRRILPLIEAVAPRSRSRSPIKRNNKYKPALQRRPKMLYKYSPD